MADLLSYAERTYPQDSRLIDGIRALEHEIAEFEAADDEDECDPTFYGRVRFGDRPDA